MPDQNILIYDSTLRDGAQGEHVSFSKDDKLRIAEKLDELGVAYIEGGWPASNPRDFEFFRDAAAIKFRYAKLCAFGCTRRKDLAAADDPQLRALLDSGAPVCTIVGKTPASQAAEILNVSEDENLAMIRESCRFLADAGREVIFDAEHFFDAWNEDPDYAKRVLTAACEGGASAVTICDTNGGLLPVEILDVTKQVRSFLPDGIILGIHCHNDSGTAVANSIVAVRSGARLVQGTINGIGERCGNANLCTIIPNFELKTDFRCLPPGHLAMLKDVSDFVCEKANMRPDAHAPYVGESAFAHKAGLHVDAIAKNPVTFEHVRPESVGNRRRILISELSGRHSLTMKAAEFGIDLRDSRLGNAGLQELKKRERAGYEYETAEASFVVLMHKVMNLWPSYFTLDGYRVIIEKRGAGDRVVSEATVKLTVGGVTQLTAAEGDGPVNALDLALRKALERFYPALRDVSLIDFKVRILENLNGTAAQTRVRIQSHDSTSVWDTVGVSENIIEASWIALADSVEYALFKKHIVPSNCQEGLES